MLAAQGILFLPFETGWENAYEVYTHYHYEDDKCVALINPAKQKEKKCVNMGIEPERVRISFLRAEQKAFFEESKPEIFSRFRKD